SVLFAGLFERRACVQWPDHHGPHKNGCSEPTLGAAVRRQQVFGGAGGGGRVLRQPCGDAASISEERSAMWSARDLDEKVGKREAGRGGKRCRVRGNTICERSVSIVRNLRSASRRSLASYAVWVAPSPQSLVPPASRFPLPSSPMRPILALLLLPTIALAQRGG